jgi:N-succinyldiaminopimelate aminotransferase
MTKLAIEHDAVNLGQGFPDFEGPEFIKQAALDAIAQGQNQYCRSFGIPALNAAISEHQQRFWGLSYDPETEITVYNGATEAIFVALNALCEVGDEVVVFEPFYDSYRASIASAGAKETVVTLRAPDFSFDRDALAAAITPKTRAILLNTPHNPTGKVYSREELEFIAGLCVENDILAISDEVYEHLVFEGEHICLASLPGMRERTVVISSAGKTFSFTGWKIGHTCAAPDLTRALRTCHQFVTFCNGTPFQHAMSLAYRAPDEYFQSFVSDYRKRRDRLCDGLRDVGFEVLTPAGTYFALTDIRPLGYEDDVEFCRMLPAEIGVAAIPPSAFYANKDEGRHLVRWAFCKTDAVLDSALERLQGLKR